MASETFRRHAVYGVQVQALLHGLAGQPKTAQKFSILRPYLRQNFRRIGRAIRYDETYQIVCVPNGQWRALYRLSRCHLCGCRIDAFATRLVFTTRTIVTLQSCCAVIWRSPKTSINLYYISLNRNLARKYISSGRVPHVISTFRRRYSICCRKMLTGHSTMFFSSSKFPKNQDIIWHSLAVHWGVIYRHAFCAQFTLYHIGFAITTCKVVRRSKVIFKVSLQSCQKLKMWFSIFYHNVTNLTQVRDYATTDSRKYVGSLAKTPAFSLSQKLIGARKKCVEFATHQENTPILNLFSTPIFTGFNP